MSTASRNRAPALLLAAVLVSIASGLGAVAWSHWQSEIDTSPKSTGRPAQAFDLASLQASPQAFQPKPLSGYREITTRPVFSETRRPLPIKKIVAKPVKQVPKPTHIPIGQLQLTGVIVSGDKKRVLITSPKLPEGSWYSHEDIVEGWKIVDILPNFARMEAGANSHQLQLYVDNEGITRD